jgi:hypothetical protein
LALAASFLSKGFADFLLQRMKIIFQFLDDVA